MLWAAFAIGWLACGWAWLLGPCPAIAASPERLESPDQRVAASVHLDDQGGLRYAVDYDGQRMLEDCLLSLELADGPLGAGGWTIVKIDRSEHDSTWRPVTGERSEVRDHYRQMVIELQDPQTPPCRVRWTFRAYDQGMALRYTLVGRPGQTQAEIRREHTEFRFLERSLALGPCTRPKAATKRCG